MVKTYLRYVHEEAFGIVSSSRAPTITDASGKFAFAPAIHEVLVWDLKRGELVRYMTPDGDDYLKGEVTSILLLDNNKLGVGYSNGMVRCFDAAQGGSPQISLMGHKGVVSCLATTKNGMLLCSGGNDTNLIVWDVVAERGICRLKGHKDAITAVRFVQSDGSVSTSVANSEKPPSTLVISASKDALVKVWDVESQQCLQTIVGHRAEVWSIAVSPSGDRLVSGTNDELLRVWNLDKCGSETNPAQFMGSISRSSASDRCTSLQFKTYNETALLGAQTSGKLVDVFRLRSDVEAKKKLKRRMKRFREKVAAREQADELAGDWADEDEEATAPGGVASPDIIASDEVELVGTLRCSSKLASFAFLVQSQGKDQSTVRLLLSLQSNAIEVHEICLPTADTTVTVSPPQKLLGLELPGHRTEPRCLSFSSDSSLIASAASGSLKVWSSSTKKCIRSMEDLDGESPLKSQCNCLVWLPGDRYICVGTKDGSMIICDLGSGEVSRHDAHTGSVSSMDVSFDNVLCTGSADHEVKFWDFEMVAQEDGTEALSVEHSKTLKMGDDVTCVKFSKTRDPVKSLLAVATLDSTVRVYFKDSLKFYLQLFGHKLPVFSMDISDDSTVIVTGSADKTIKVWGLDFGDCHRSLLAHSDIVTSVAFVPRTHYVFTSSKDKTIKYWDIDHFEKILTLEGHVSEIWALSISADGSTVVTCGHDRTLRLWSRTDEPVFLEEEREKEFEGTLGAADMGQTYEANMGSGLIAPTEDEEVEENGRASRGTMESLKGGERLMEALEIAETETAALKAWAKSNQAALASGQPALKPRSENPLLLGVDPDRYILKVLRMVKQPDLEEALLVLPFHLVERIIERLTNLLSMGLGVELCTRCAVFIVKLHHAPLTASGRLIPLLQRLQLLSRSTVTATRDMTGTNLAAMRLLKRSLEANQAVIEVFDFPDAKTTKKKKKGAKQ